MKLWDLLMLKLRKEFADHIADGHHFGSDVPIGAIIMWYDNTYIPDGWFFCNGTYGTPDLRYRIPFCLSNAAELGNIFKISTGTTYTCIYMIFIMKRY